MTFRAAFLVLSLAAMAPAQSGFPFQSESLRYSVNWPSGLSLGEATLGAQKAGDRWHFDLTIDAAVPGFAVADRFKSVASLELCSLEFDRDTTHGGKKTREKTTFDYRKSTARRATVNGGKTDFAIPACARDALDYVFYARRELGQGRVPPQQTVYHGAPYNVRLEYTGAQTVAVNEKREQADRVVVYLKGPASDSSFEIFFARDPARTPLVIRVPLALGSFSMELVR